MITKLKKQKNISHTTLLNIRILEKSIYQKILDFWFGGQNFMRNIHPIILIELWSDIWFSKNHKQELNDMYLKKEFELYYDYIENQNLNYSEMNFEDLFSLVILYDQMSRNIFRKSSKAYKYDARVRNIIDIIYQKVNLSSDKIVDNFPIQICIHIMLVYLHSENIEDQYLQKILYGQLYMKYHNEYKMILQSLKQISENHFMRILNFGRIQERNQYLNRESTLEENEFLKKLY
jgi:uncharacterized protein (DUF924 family)